MDKLKNLLGMGWTNPWVRTFAQAALVPLVAAQMDWVDLEVWKIAVLSGGSAVFAKAQGMLRG